jgi:hypothetical protein
MKSLQWIMGRQKSCEDSGRAEKSNYWGWTIYYSGWADQLFEIILKATICTSLYIFPYNC